MKVSQMRILIISSRIDVHADAVRWALAQHGCEAALWDISDFPAVTNADLWFGRNEPTVELRNGATQVAGAYDTVWVRRKYVPTPKADTHIEDVRIVERESEKFVANALTALDTAETLWINHPESDFRADLKVNQLRVAKKVGFITPATYMGNSPDAVRLFYARHEGAVVYKAFRSDGWENSDGTNTVLRTSRLDGAHVANDFAIAACPGIYQELIQKDYEVRVTVFGSQVFAVKIDSQKDGESVDWRYDFRPGEQPFVTIALPNEVTERCIAICKLLALTFAAFDFIVDRTGTYVFLELNPAGQFLFAEHHVPDILLLDEFARFLLRSDSVHRNGPALHLKDYFASSSYETLQSLKLAQRPGRRKHEQSLSCNP